MKAISKILELSNNKKIVLLIVALLLSCVIVYSNSLFNGFVLDDNGLVFRNLSIRSLDNLNMFFSRAIMKGYYRPLLSMSFALDYFIWGLNPLGFHLTNILLHFICAILFSLLIKVLFDDYFLSFVTGCLFIVHPINSVTVNYISDRGNVLCAVFMLMGILLLLRAIKKKSWPLIFLGISTYICALLSRENAVLFCLYLGCAFALIYKKEDRSLIWKIMSLAGVVSLGYLFLRSRFLPILDNEIFDQSLVYSVFEKSSAFMLIIAKYLYLLVCPFKIYFFRRIDPGSGFEQPGIFWLFPVLCVFLIWVISQKDRRFSFAIAWFAVGVLPLYRLMSTRPEVGLIMQDSWVYFSSAGLFMLVALFLKKGQRLWPKKIRIIVSLLLIIFFAAITMKNNVLWKNEHTYCSYWLKEIPKNSIALSGLGSYYYEQKKYEKARVYYQLAIKANQVKREGGIFRTKQAGAMFNQLGMIALAFENEKEAQAYFKQAARVNPSSPKSMFNLGAIKFKAGDIEQAIHYYQLALIRDPDYFPAHYDLAIVYARQHQEQKALEHGMRAEQLNPGCFDRNQKSPTKPE